MDKNLSENEREIQFIEQLNNLGYESVDVKNENDLISNLRTQLNIFNKDVLDGKLLSDTEFKNILHHLEKGSIVEKSVKLKDRYELKRDNGDEIYINFFNSKHWCKNIYQVTNQITVTGKYINRYDVTILINGLPLIQTELKKNGIAIKEAFKQTNRYQKDSYGFNTQLFHYIQIFVISNIDNTKYYANNEKLNFEQTFFWANIDNDNITSLTDFTDDFLEPCHASKMISQYIVNSVYKETNFILKPYQCYATEAVINRVENTNLNGYIWHTTGSGKTLTSFKTAQLLQNIDEVQKTLFVVDRKDLDYQTTVEFNNFSEGCVDVTEDTKSLIKQLLDDNVPLVVTTIQKLHMAIKKEGKLSKIKDYKIVFIFDECHRSQFGESHKAITKFFKNGQLIGFTGTPIFADNSNNQQTTKDLFDKQLHNYNILNAITDENVLGFSIKYKSTVEQKESEEEFKNKKDVKVQGNTDTEEIYSHPDRIKMIAEDIINEHNTYTKNKKFNAILATSSIDNALAYYDIFKKIDHNLKVTTIFSFSFNEEDRDDGNLEEDDMLNNGLAATSRNRLDGIIEDYEKLYNISLKSKTDKLSSKIYDDYHKDVSRRLKGVDSNNKPISNSQKIDILIVVNMFLTGFDSKFLNTLYVDKNFKYHGLLQGFSRTNRVYDNSKPFGNIIVYRNLKKDVDKAIALFADKDASEVIFQPSFDELVTDFNNIVSDLLIDTPTAKDVDNLPKKGEKAVRSFIEKFRALIRLKNKLSFFYEFSFENDIEGLNFQEFESFQGKYLDIYESVKNKTDELKVSILDEINFETDLLSSEEINVDYILGLLSELYEKEDDISKEKRNSIIRKIDGNPDLKSKKELVLQFIEKELVQQSKDETNKKFTTFKNERKNIEIEEYCDKYSLDINIFKSLLKNYSYRPDDKFFQGDTTIQLDTIFLNKLGLRERQNLKKEIEQLIKALHNKYC